MSTTGLNPLVDKIRAAHPGAYDDLNDAELTMKVLAKYPQYGDLAQPYQAQPQPKMQTSLAPQLVRGATSALPAIGATVAGLASAPGVATAAGGAALGAMGGEQAKLLANRAIFGNQETSPVSKAGLTSTAEQGAIAGATTGILGGLSKLGEMTPSAKMAAAGQQFQALKGSIGENPVQMTDKLADSLGDIKEAVDTGSTLPSVVNKFVTRIADTDQGPLTYGEARQFYSNISNLSASERMAAKASDLRLINNFKHALNDAISDTAENAGQLGQYQQAMRGYAAGAARQDMLDAAKNTLARYAPWALRGLAFREGWKLWERATGGTE